MLTDRVARSAVKPRALPELEGERGSEVPRRDLG